MVIFPPINTRTKNKNTKADAKHKKEIFGDDYPLAIKLIIKKSLDSLS